MTPSPPDPRPFEHLSIEATSTVDRVVEELRRAVFEGELPPGTPLREVALAESLAVSRSTVREALGALVAEGLADRVPNKGTQVRALDPEAIHDVGRARAVIEMAGLTRWPEASEEARAGLRSAVADFEQVAGTGATAAELTAAHLAIHAALAGLTESPRLVAMADTLYTEIRLALASVDRIRRNALEQVHSHAALVDLLEAGRLEDAAAELRHHLDHAEQAMLESLGWELAGDA
ncbi:MAG TPA: GntR family transcriptional regulator [Marmoricola sp.]|nr:GntR family transcriptional regulator [Marmoricola sp.]